MNREEQEYLDKVHESDMAMLLEVDRICKKHGIQYFLHGGTFLGAVRHKDFIPWDDDVDILFLRKDYEKFIEVFERESEERFKLLGFEKYPQFFDFISKIADMKLTYEKTGFGAEDFYEGRYSHPTLDLFVFDIEAEHHRLQLAGLKLLYALAMGHRPYINYGRFKGIMKAAAWVLSRIGKLIPFKAIARRYIKLQTLGGVSKLYGERKLLFISNEQPDPRYWGLDFEPEHLLDGADTAVIRGHEFPVPKLYDKWLTKTYGDYMTLPDEASRVPMHVNILKSED